MLENVSGIGEVVRTILVAFVFPFVVKWLSERRKGDFARRLALIAADIAASVYAANPELDEARLVEQIARALAEQFPTVTPPVIKRVATAALAAARVTSAMPAVSVSTSGAPAAPEVRPAI